MDSSTDNRGHSHAVYDETVVQGPHSESSVVNVFPCEDTTMQRDYAFEPPMRTDVEAHQAGVHTGIESVSTKSGRPCAAEVVDDTDCLSELDGVGDGCTVVHIDASDTVDEHGLNAGEENPAIQERKRKVTHIDSDEPVTHIISSSVEAQEASEDVFGYELSYGGLRSSLCYNVAHAASVAHVASTYHGMDDTSMSSVSPIKEIGSTASQLTVGVGTDTPQEQHAIMSIEASDDEASPCPVDDSSYAVSKPLNQEDTLGPADDSTRIDKPIDKSTDASSMFEDSQVSLLPCMGTRMCPPAQYDLRSAAASSLRDEIAEAPTCSDVVPKLIKGNTGLCLEASDSLPEVPAARIQGTTTEEREPADGGQETPVFTAESGICLKEAKESGLFQAWYESINKDSRIRLAKVNFQSLDVFGPKVGFIKFNVDTFIGAAKVPEVVFMHDDTFIGEAQVPGVDCLHANKVAILVVLHHDSHCFTLVVRQPRVPVGFGSLGEIPTGILNGSGDFAGIAAQKMKDIGMQLNESHIVDLTRLVYHDRYVGVFPSCGSCAEYNRILLYEKPVTAEELEDMKHRTNSNPDADDLIELQIISLGSLWKVSPDAKTLAALTLYERIKKCDKRNKSLLLPETTHAIQGERDSEAEPRLLEEGNSVVKIKLSRTSRIGGERYEGDGICLRAATRGVRARERELGKTHLEVAHSLLNLSTCCIKQGLIDAHRDSFDRMRTIYKDCHGKVYDNSSIDDFLSKHVKDLKNRGYSDSDLQMIWWSAPSSAVAVLVILHIDDGRRFTFVAGHSRLWNEIPAGTTLGVAAKEIEDVVGMQLRVRDMVDMTQFAYETRYPGIFIGNELTRLYLYETNVDAEVLESWKTRLANGETEGGLVKLQVIPLESLWKASPDAKTLAALTLYSRLQKSRGSVMENGSQCDRASLNNDTTNKAQLAPVKEARRASCRLRSMRGSSRRGSMRDSRRGSMRDSRRASGESSRRESRRESGEGSARGSSLSDSYYEEGYESGSYCEDEETEGEGAEGLDSEEGAEGRGSSLISSIGDVEQRGSEEADRKQQVLQELQESPLRDQAAQRGLAEPPRIAVSDQRARPSPMEVSSPQKVTPDTPSSSSSRASSWFRCFACFRSPGKDEEEEDTESLAPPSLQHSRASLEQSRADGENRTRADGLEQSRELSMFVQSLMSGDSGADRIDEQIRELSAKIDRAKEFGNLDTIENAKVALDNLHARAATRDIQNAIGRGDELAFNQALDKAVSCARTEADRKKIGRLRARFYDERSRIESIGSSEEPVDTPKGNVDSELRAESSELRHESSELRHVTSELRHAPSDLRPQISELQGEASNEVGIDEASVEKQESMKVVLKAEVPEEERPHLNGTSPANHNLELNTSLHDNIDSSSAALSATTKLSDVCEKSNCDSSSAAVSPTRKLSDIFEESNCDSNSAALSPKRKLSDFCENSNGDSSSAAISPAAKLSDICDKGNGDSAALMSATTELTDVCDKTNGDSSATTTPARKPLEVCEQSGNLT